MIVPGGLSRRLSRGSWRLPMALAAAAACSLPATSLPATAQAPLAVVRVAPGVHLIGSTTAPLRLTEYVSYTCSHCARFESEAGEALDLGYVRPAKIVREVRNLVRDPVDLAAAMLANCGDAERFARNHAALMRSQDAWLGRLRATTEAQRARYGAGSNGDRRRALARDAGLYEIMRPRGYDAASLDRCLGDEALARALAGRSAEYARQGVTGTPSFAIDGALLEDVHDWASLKPRLDARR